MHLSSAQLDDFTSAQNCCLTPFEFPDLDAWRDAVATAAREMVQGTMSQVSLFPVQGLVRMRSPDIEPANTALYVRDWLPQDAVLPLVRNEGLQVYSRSDLVRSRPEFGRRYLASAIYNEHYRAVGAIDSIGIVQQSPTFAQVMVFNSQFGAPNFGATGLRLMRLLEPAFLAGARSVFDWQAASASMVRLVDELPGALALYGVTGARLHWNRALRGLINVCRNPTALERGLGVLGRELATLSSAGARDAARAPRAPVRIVNGHRLSGTLARSGIHGSPPLFVIRVESLAQVRPQSTTPTGARLADAEALHALTPRQRDVALRLAMGDANESIAAALEISPHTARRHTEQVLRRLGVGTRQQAAAILSRLLLRSSEIA